jgi:flagellar biosynthesis protein FlhG
LGIMAEGSILKLVQSAESVNEPEPALMPRGAPRFKRAAPRARRLLSIGGGKGGIGKSLVSANLAIALARRGQRVVLVDADLGGANLHTTLGLDLPRRTLSDFVLRKVERLEDVVSPTGVENLGLISGALDGLEAASPKHAQKVRLLRHVRALDVDYAILDLGAGTHANVLDFFLVSDHGILVLVPEPTSVENAYRFVKAAFWRRMRNVAQVFGYDELLRGVMGGASFRSPVELVAAVVERDPEAGSNLARQLAAFRPRLVVNQVRTSQDAEMGHAVVAAWRKYFGLEMEYLGAVDYDDDVWRAVRQRQPLLVSGPDRPSARAFEKIAERLLLADQVVQVADPA